MRVLRNGVPLEDEEKNVFSFDNEKLYLIDTMELPLFEWLNIIRFPFKRGIRYKPPPPPR